MPILARYLEPEDFGKIAIFAATLTFASPLVHMALYSFINVEFFQKNKEHLSSLVSSIIFILPLTGIFIALLLIGARWFFGDFLNLPIYYYFLIPLLAGFQNIKAIMLGIFRNLSKALEFGIVNISATGLNLCLALILIVGLGWNWQGSVTAQIVTAFIFGFVCLLLLKREGYFKLNFSKKIALENFEFSFPLIPSIFAISIINQIDRFFIKEISGERALGMYAIGISFGMIITFFLYSFEQVIIPRIYKKLSDKKNLKTNHRQLIGFTKIYVVLIFTLALLLSAGSYLLFEINFLPIKYLPARQYIFWITIAYSLWGVCTILTPYINFSKKTKYLLFAAIIGCVINLIGNYFLIHQYGAIGAAYSKVITFGTLVLLYWYFGKTLQKMEWFTGEPFSFSIKDFLSFIK